MDAIINIFTTILSYILGKNDLSEFRKEYDNWRYEVAEALTLYANCYSAPIDLAAQPNHKLPQSYIEASDKLRELGSRGIARCSTMSKKQEKKLPIAKADLSRVSRLLIGLANSMCTPYGQAATLEEYDRVDRRVEQIKSLLRLND